ncbi:MAG: hypothetical protein ACXVRJ_06125 [Gaiellaceae bacterium]
MARPKLRPQAQVIERCRGLRGELRSALDRLPSSDPAVVDAVWSGEALGTLLWGLQLLELPPYDRPFDPDEVVETEPGDGVLRDGEEIALERESARLWHWRARTTGLQAAGALELPARYATYDQLIAATAMRGHEQGLLPEPMRGDFRAYGKVYRHLTPEQHAEAHSLAVERHHALNWLSGEGATWQDVPLDT